MNTDHLLSLYRDAFDAWLRLRVGHPWLLRPEPEDYGLTDPAALHCARQIASNLQQSYAAGYTSAWRAWRRALALGVFVEEPRPSTYFLAPEEAAAIQACVLTGEEVAT